MLTITLKGGSNSAAKPQLSEQPLGLPPTQPTPGPSSDLELRIEQLEEEMTMTKNCRETIISIYQSQFIFL